MASSSGASSSKRFPVVIVSRAAYEIFQDYEAAWCRFTTTPSGDLQAVGDAYADLCQRRKEVYELIERLEADEPVTARAPVVILRFD